MDRDNDEKNAYEVVGAGSDATEADIKRAFRQRSLKTHPDRVRALLPLSAHHLYSLSPEPTPQRCRFVFTFPPHIDSDHSLSSYIARLFHELTQAYELLLDPLRRMALDAKLRIQEARKQRYANFDKKRKAMLEELEEAERADREAKSAEVTKKQRYAQEAEQIRDAGRRLVEERQVELRRQQEEAERAEKSAQEELEPPPLGEYLTPSLSTFCYAGLRRAPCQANTIPLSASSTHWSSILI
jgi:DnaJ family protein C protein 17